MHTELHFSLHDLRNFVGKSFSELKAYTSNLAKGLRVATSGRYDDTKFFIEDARGNPALQVLFLSDRLSFWNARSGTSVYLQGEGSEPSVFTPEMLEAINVAVKYVGNCYHQCMVCGRWLTDWNRFTSYDFSGLACERCYNPKVHLPPNSK
jgi:hypothetical protein